MKKNGRHVIFQRILLFVCSLVLLIVLSFSSYNLSVALVQRVARNKNQGIQDEESDDASDGAAHEIRNDTKGTRKILLWTKLFSGWDFMVPRPGVFDDCPESRCEITSDRSAIHQSDAVIFHIRTFAMYDMPLFRDARQKWVFFSMEAPPHSAFPGFPFMYNMFNWTMSYRRDSDIVITYGEIVANSKKKSSRKPEELNAIWNGKTKLAVWMASHCITDGRREKYVEELQNYIDVDVLGACGMAMCPQNETSACLRAFAKKYKFFFAFENALCKDYVTEKFFGILQYDIVPVVFGSADYSLVAPKHSYINALDFAPAALAQYLNHVASNSTLYFKYLEWKDYGFDIINKMDRCKLCTKLHSDEFKSKIVHADIGKWWIDESSCRKWGE